MPSSTEIPRSQWIGRLHYYTGLCLLFFVSLFAFTGLLLNHPRWKFAQFWDSRCQTAFEQPITPPLQAGDLAQARNIMSQLGIRGEIAWTGSDANRLNFNVSRPGHIYSIKTDLERNRASVQRMDLNAWGVLHILHTFTGVRLDDPRNRRDWFLTSVWALAMDAVAAGLVLMVLSSYWMWWQTGKKRLLGALALAAGFLACGLFCFALRWIC